MKLVCENIDDILQPKSKEELIKEFDKNFKRYTLLDGRTVWVDYDQIEDMGGEYIDVTRVYFEDGKSLYLAQAAHLFSEEDLEEIEEGEPIDDSLEIPY